MWSRGNGPFPWLNMRKIFFVPLVAVMVWGWWSVLPSPLFRVPYSTVLLDREERIIGLQAAADGQIRCPDVERLPGNYVVSVLAYEDKMFLLHSGINWFALGRALIRNLRAGRIVCGGSTLSMQVVRLALGNPPRTIPEKLKEMVLALRLEQSHTKLQILNMYASHAPFGGNIVGLRAAALKYFNRQPEQLSWAESALLAVLPNAPALLYPGRNNARLKAKRDGLLRELFRMGCFGQDTYELAVAEPLPQKYFDIPSIAPHLFSRACQEKKGQVCRSHLDSRLQQQVNEIVERHTAMLSRNYIYNVSVLVAHIPSGEVRAYVGNSDRREGSRGTEVDIIRSVRSSGSILKPVLYTLMLQDGFILPGTLIPDIPSRYGDYEPSNFNRDFRGAVPAETALAQSLNIPFVRLLKEYSYARFYDDLKQLGIHSLDRPADHYGLSLILGGAETSLWDICNLYGGMASVLRHYNEEDGQYFDGEYERLKLWRGEEGEDGERIRGKGGSGKGLLRASAIWQTFRALENVERPDMESGWKNFVSTMNLSWKTGTSFGFRDAWAVGVNPDYVIGVWVGNADGEGRPGLVGVRCAAPVLFEVAGLLDVQSRFYEPAEEMLRTAVCRQSGFRASALCEETDTVLICSTGMKTGTCPFHRLVYLDSSGMWQVDSDCESVSRMVAKPWFVLPPVQEYYYCRTHSDYRKLPPFRPGCSSGDEEVMEMIYPQNGTKVFIPRDFGGKPGKVVFEAVHRIPSARIYWYVDNRYLGVTDHIHQMELYLKEGTYRLLLMDEEGHQLQQEFRIVGK